jgi:putative heme-binding domain-containing protein
MRPYRWPVFLALLLSCLVGPTIAQDDAIPESAYVKLLKKAPEERVGQIVEIIGKRGTADDLAVVFDRAVKPGGFAPAVRLKALEVLADAALTRQLRPRFDLVGLVHLIDSETGNVRLAAIKLAGLWKVDETIRLLLPIASAKDTPPPIRSAAFAALAAIDSPPARVAIEALTGPNFPASVRALGVAALARFDIEKAVGKAVEALTDDARIEDVTPLIAAFLDRQGGGDKLAQAFKAHPPSADGARLALRAVYALGRSDEALIAILSKAAGIEAEPRLPTKEEMDTIVQEVAAKGNSERGEAIFRRGELNCMKCHAIAGAAGGVGPDLSSLGLSSPVDYVVNSILIPDQAIKEEFQTRQVLTDDGRVLQGIVVEEDDKKLVLKDATGELRVIPVGSIEESKKGGSLMPRGLASLLTRAEFVDIVRFLSELGKPGPYALRSTPTIQRWRVLKTSPDDIAGVLEADPGRWSPVYGQMNGALPLGDVTAATPEKSASLQGEIAVSAAGPITFRLNSTKGLTAWLDDQALPAGESPTLEVAEGTHKLTLRVEIAARDFAPIRVEVVKPEGSSAEFSVVGGR